MEKNWLTTKDDEYPIIYYGFQKHPNGGCLGIRNHQPVC